MTPVFTCGWECGQLGTVGQHWSSGGGSVSINTTIKRNGARALRVNPTASSSAYVTSPTLAGFDIWVGRVAIYFTTLPSINQTLLVGANTGAGAVFNASDSKIYPGYLSGTVQFGSSGVAVTTGVWYILNVSVNASANPWLIDVKVDATTTTQMSRATTASGDTAFRVGMVQSSSTTADAYFDDLVITSAGGDYPIGDGYVNHFVPTSDGTHNVAGAADFRRGDTTTDILNATTTAYQLVDDVPLDDTTPDADDHIRIVAPANNTDYVELVFGPASGISTPTAAPQAVEVIAEVFAAGTGLSDEQIRVNDNGTTDTIYDGTQVAGVTTGIYKRKHYATAPTGGAWTVVSGAGNFNNLRLRYGYASDANPDKSLMAAMIEADFAQGATTLQGAGDTAAASATTGAPVITLQGSGSSTAASATASAGAVTLQVSGATAAASSTTGEASILIPGSGDTAAASATAGEPLITMQAAGDTAAVSANAGAPTITLQAAGDTAAASATAGQADFTVGGSGDTAAVSSTTGEPVITLQGAGDTSAAAANSGAPVVTLQASGSDASDSATAGAPTLTLQAAGDTAAVSATAAQGLLILPGAGETAAAGANAGAPVITLQASGSTAAASATTGEPEATGQQEGSGDTAAESATTGAPLITLQASGSSASASTTTAAAVVILQGAGDSASVSETTGAPTITLQVAGATATQSETTGEPTVEGGAEQGGGDTVAVSFTSGEPLIVLQGAGDTSTVSSTSGSPTTISATIIGRVINFTAGTDQMPGSVVSATATRSTSGASQTGSAINFDSTGSQLDGDESSGSLSASSTASTLTI